MNFLHPLGLLGLIGIPILIIIYIIKSKYAEQTVASTYLWTLSERFLKRKKPISPLAGIISLILQILAVTAISLIIAHPIITIPGSAREYCFILDASGSMNAEENGTSRFDRAKEMIGERISASSDGSRYTLVTVSDLTNAVFEQITDKKQALQMLDELQVGYVDPDFNAAVGTAQKYFDENRSVKTVLFTDTVYEQAENIEVVNVAGAETNAAISGVNWLIADGRLTLTGRVDSYNYEGGITLSAYADGSKTALETVELTLTAGKPSEFKIEKELKSFTSLRLSVNAEDGIALDDEYVIYDVKSEEIYSILLVSERPFFLQTVLESVGHKKITVTDPDDYSASVRGYGLYIFDCCAPKELPSDGAVWFLDPPGSVPESGFSVQGEVVLSRGDLVQKSTSTSSSAAALLKDVTGNEIYVAEYVKCSLYRNFTTLFSYKGNPVIFAGSNMAGHREVVFAFDLHTSNLPMLVDFVVLIDNLMTFSFPDVVENTDHYAGDRADINVIANCESIRVDSPLGNVAYLNTDQAVASMTLAEVGTYTVTVTVSGIPRVYYIHSALPEAERDPAPEAEKIALIGQAENEGFDGTYDPLTPLFICLALLFLCDWLVYCYEKYQLR